MFKITSVEAQKNSPHRFNIFLDGQFAFGADEDLVVDYHLSLGKMIDQITLEKLLFEAEVGKLMERMYRLFNIRQRSEKEVRLYLQKLLFKRKIQGKQEFSQEAVELLIKKLHQKGLLSDEKFAKAWVESRSKKKGKIALKLELLKKGIAKDTIDEVLEQNPVDERLVAKQLLEKKLKIWKSISPKELRIKAYQFLMRRGFNFEIIKTVVEKNLQK